MRLLRSQWFSGMMILLFALAWAAPQAAATINAGNAAKTVAIVLIFFLSGVSLRTEDSLRALRGWRLHLFIQGINLLLLPLVCWLVVRPLASTLPEGLVIGFYVLAVVPTTITSCVVFTQVAGGNTAAALFNAVAGNLAGVFVSPAILILMLGTSKVQIDLAPWRLFAQLGTIVLLPFLVGQALHVKAALRFPALKRWAGRINRWCILLIIYLAFADVFLRDAGVTNWQEVALPLAALIPAHLLLLWLTNAAARGADFSRMDRIAIIFCVPQKTLALGLPMAAAVLSNRPDLLGLASLPILVYHPLQLLVAGIIEQRYLATSARGIDGAAEPAVGADS